MTAVERFHRLSEALTGVRPLPTGLAAEYLARLETAPEGKRLPELLDEYDAILAGEADVDDAISRRIMGDPDLLEPARAAIVLWYLGELRGAASVGGRPEHSFQGLLWDVIGAHPPGLSGGYFGHWSYPPDN